MIRFSLEKIEEWNARDKRKPLVLMGARQVGKSWLMDEFARLHYPRDVVKVNFMRSAALRTTIGTSDLDPKALIRLVQAETGKRIVPGQTLLVLDEIQECPAALTSLKFFNEDLPELAVMAAGSLLGLSVGKADAKNETEAEEKRFSFPVGKVERLDIRPMSFAEFLLAVGRDGLLDGVRAGDWKTVQLLSREFETQLKDYLLVGGMPEAVEIWSETASFADVRRVQKSILADYDDDFKKHAPKDLLAKIRLLWNNVSPQLAKENKKFIYSALKPGARAREYEAALQWLDDAGMVRQVFRVCPPRLPIRAYQDFGAFKLYMHDVGLLGAMSRLPPQSVLEGNALLTNFKGAMTEQFVLQELVAAGFEPGYWTPDSGISEVDFVIQGERDVYPVEVKSATNTKAKSLAVYLRQNCPPFAIKSSLLPYSATGAIHSLPLYVLGERICSEIGLYD